MAHEIYLHLDMTTIGESLEMQHKNWIVVDTFSCEVTAAESNGKFWSGTCSHSPMNISKHIDRSSPRIAIAACKREKFSNVKIDVCKPSTTGLGSVIVLKCRLSNARCISYSLDGADNSTDSFSLAYEEIEWGYTYVDPRTFVPLGTTTKKWDVLENKES